MRARVRTRCEQIVGRGAHRTRRDSAMANQVFQMRSRFEHPAAELFAWHARDGALDRLTPPWSGITVEPRSGTIRGEQASAPFAHWSLGR